MYIYQFIIILFTLLCVLICRHFIKVSLLINVDVKYRADDRYTET